MRREIHHLSGCHQQFIVQISLKYFTTVKRMALRRHRTSEVSVDEFDSKVISKEVLGLGTNLFNQTILVFSA